MGRVGRSLKDAKGLQDGPDTIMQKTQSENYSKIGKIQSTDGIQYSHQERRNMILCAMEQTIDRAGTGGSAGKTTLHMKELLRISQ